MLTSDLLPTSGDAFIAGHSVVYETEKTRRRIGYVPQYDAHFEFLTGREHLALYASIKGVPSKFIADEMNKKLDEVGLSQFDADRPSMHYSGGMKRKLSIACATIGEPDCILADEPTAAIDPSARRDIWKTITNLVSRNNPRTNKPASVIVTTHSMEECEALCRRIAIMAEGRFRCLGSAQRLKARFGRGYQLELKLKQAVDTDDDYKRNAAVLARYKDSKRYSEDLEAAESSLEVSFHLDEAQSALEDLTNDSFFSDLLAANDANASLVVREASSASGVSLRTLACFATMELRVQRLHQFVRSTYTGAVLRERQDLKVRYEVCAASLSLADVFSGLENNEEELGLAETGIGQTSLEQVFLERI